MMNGIQILVAEDDAEDRFIMMESFKELQAESTIKFVEDGSYVVPFLEANPGLPISLIVLDLNMPKLNGTETLRLLKNHEVYSKIPVIIFSTSVNEIEKEACITIGAQDYITKPSSYNAYMDTCRMLYDISLKTELSNANP